jgi:hypothetical protein
MDNKFVLSKTVLHAAEKLGLSMDQLALILDMEKPSINQLDMTLDPDSKTAKKALLLIQIFQSLDALNGGDLEWIQHFMCSQNQITGGVPMEQIQNETGLIKVQECLQALLMK